MAYSDYGGYAYRNKVRVEERSDATITPEGDTFGTPGMWPGFLTVGMEKEEQSKRLEWPSGHAVLGDGPIYVVLYKQSWFQVFRANEELEKMDLIDDLPEDAIKTYDTIGGEEQEYLDTDYFMKRNLPIVMNVDGVKIEVFLTEEDNYYQYAKMTLPDGTVWHGWSGYGVGAGLENAGYGFSTEERERKLWELFPD